MDTTINQIEKVKMEEIKVTETRKLASFRVVDDIQPIDGADAIELAVVGGWKVVTKKGEFTIGDRCVYFEIDSFLPSGEPAWQFLVDKQSRTQNEVVGHRLRTIKLRGQISQGLILPTSALPAVQYILCEELDDAAEAYDKMPKEVQAEAIRLLNEIEAGAALEDLNLNTLLNIVKWDPPLPAQLAGQAEGLFPSWIRKTDQERAQNLKAEILVYEDSEVELDVRPDQLAPEAIASGRVIVRDNKVISLRPAKANRDARYEISMKLDGSSCTLFHRDGEVGVCSRNLQLKVNEENKDNSFVSMLFKTGLHLDLPKLGNIAIQGELMGPNIQGNREGLKDFAFFVFDAQNLDTMEFYTPIERMELMTKLSNKVRHVPLWNGTAFVEHISPEDVVGFTLDELGLDTMEKLLAYAEGKSIAHLIREGLVYKRLDGKFSFKTISNKYLEKEKD